MHLVSIILAVALAALFLAAGVPKIFAANSARERAAHAGFSTDAYRLIGGLEAAGALGLVAGIAFGPLGIAAGTGLLLMMVGAIVVHLRAHDTAAAMAPAIISTGVIVAYLVTVVSITL